MKACICPIVNQILLLSLDGRSLLFCISINTTAVGRYVPLISCCVPQIASQWESSTRLWILVQFILGKFKTKIDSALPEIEKVGTRNTYFYFESEISGKSTFSFLVWWLFFDRQYHLKCVECDIQFYVRHWHWQIK